MSSRSDDAEATGYSSSLQAAIQWAYGGLDLVNDELMIYFVGFAGLACLRGSSASGRQK